jgi:hypothetical protein
MDNQELIDRVEQLDIKLSQMEQERLTLPILSPFFALAKRHYSLRLITSLAILAITLSAIVYAATLTKPFNFSDGQPASASEVNANFDALYDRANTHFHPGFPEGVTGDPINFLISSGTPHPVTAGKTLYITSASNTDVSVDYISDGTDNYFSLPGSGGNFEQGLPLVFADGTSVQTVGSAGTYITGIEVVSDASVDIVRLKVDDSPGYTVTGRTLYILSLYHDGIDTSADFQIDGAAAVLCPVANNVCLPNMSLPIIVQDGSTITSSMVSNTFNITGYEIPN